MAKKIPVTSIEHEAVRTGSSVESLKQAFLDNLFMSRVNSVMSQPLMIFIWRWPIVFATG